MDELLEAVAKELYHRLCDGDDPILGPAFTRARYLDAARAVLAIARPHILAEVDVTLRNAPFSQTSLDILAKYLRDRLGGK